MQKDQVSYHNSSMPIMAMNDIGLLPRLQQELKRCSAEICEPLEVIRFTVELTSPKEFGWV
jgi:hypothetical protein